MMQNSGTLLVKLIEKFTDKFELTMKYCIKLLDGQICKILLINKISDQKNREILFIYSKELITK